MRVLVTGSSGLVGSRVAADLAVAGHAVLRIDLAEGTDLLAGIPSDFDAVVHAAARMGDEADLMDVNVRGTGEVLAAARGKRVAFLSSVDALGVFKGERAPDYLPLDAQHPCHAKTPYGRSKLQAEALCREHDAPVVILRPPGVWNEQTYGWIQDQRKRRPSFEWAPFWEFGAFIDVRDLASACIAALACPLNEHATLLVSAPDITTSGRTSRELATFVHPEVPWRGGERYERDPYCSLLDIDPAKQVLSWEPRCSWQDRPG